MFGENVCAIVHSGSTSKRKTFQDMAAGNTAGGNRMNARSAATKNGTQI